LSTIRNTFVVHVEGFSFDERGRKKLKGLDQPILL